MTEQKLTKDQVRDVQRALNAFTKKRLRGVAPLIVDGDKGQATDQRIRKCKWYLGFKAPTGAGVEKRFIQRLRSPRDRSLFPHGYVRRGIKRRVAQRLRYRKQQAYALIAPGVTLFDGVPVAKVAVKYLVFARAHGWAGRLVSGFRDPNYSQSLCYGMCGQPSCPGTCAGLGSNHVGKTEERFALDVSDYVKFGQLMARPDAPQNPRIFNDLPNDRVHFSPNGH